MIFLFLPKICSDSVDFYRGVFAAVLICAVCQWQHNVAGLPVVDVVVDPHVSVHLRPHQRDGIIFLYQCVMAMKPYRGCGAILA